MKATRGAFRLLTAVIQSSAFTSSPWFPMRREWTVPRLRGPFDFSCWFWTPLFQFLPFPPDLWPLPPFRPLPPTEPAPTGFTHPEHFCSFLAWFCRSYLIFSFSGSCLYFFCSISLYKSCKEIQGSANDHRVVRFYFVTLHRQGQKAILSHQPHVYIFTCVLYVAKTCTYNWRVWFLNAINPFYQSNCSCELTQ